MGTENAQSSMLLHALWQFKFEPRSLISHVRATKSREIYSSYTESHTRVKVSKATSLTVMGQPHLQYLKSTFAKSSKNIEVILNVIYSL